MKTELDKLKSAREDSAQSTEFEEAFRKVSKDRAEKMISDYISRHPGCKTSEIIFDLKLHPDVVLPILRKLQEAGEVRSEKIEQRT